MHHFNIKALGKTGKVNVDKNKYNSCLKIRKSPEGNGSDGDI